VRKTGRSFLPHRYVQRSRRDDNRKGLDVLFDFCDFENATKPLVVIEPQQLYPSEAEPTFFVVSLSVVMSLHDPDRDLIQRFRKGDRLAFNQLVLKYRNHVLGVAVYMLGAKDDAEDLAQDVFVKVYYGLRGFHGEALFSTWLYRITVNSCLSHRKKLRNPPNECVEDAKCILADRYSDPHTVLEKKEIKLFLEKAIQALPRDQRVVLILRDIEGLSYEAIADCLDLPLGTVRSRLHRARQDAQKKLKRLFSQDGRRSACI
jgi:RNA polymerase sigma-70 factor, ECF subfamily